MKNKLILTLILTAIVAQLGFGQTRLFTYNTGVDYTEGEWHSVDPVILGPSYIGIRLTCPDDGSASRFLVFDLGGRLHSAPYFVDNDRFSSEAERLRPEREKIRAGWGIRPDACVVLYSGKFIPKKRVMDLARAFRIVCERHPGKFHLLLAGEGPQRGALERDLSGLPVTFAGFLNQKEIPRAYAAADVMVMTSDWGETWGLSANEALASGVPVVLSDQCGCAEDLSNATAEAKVFPMGDVQRLVALLEDRRKEIADRGWSISQRRELMKVMRERFDAENTITTVRRLLD